MRGQGSPDLGFRAGSDVAAASDTALGRCRRILVLGSPGSGKSTLAGQLAKTTGLPLTCLDDLYWGPRWDRPEPASFAERVDRVVAGDRWIVDGNYASWLEPRLRRAEAVVLLDLSTPRCLLAVCRRELRRARGDRASLPAAVRADGRRRLDPGFFLRVARFRSKVRPEMLRLLAAHPEISVVTLRHGAARRSFTAQLEAPLRPGGRA